MDERRLKRLLIIYSTVCMTVNPKITFLTEKKNKSMDSHI